MRLDFIWMAVSLSLAIGNDILEAAKEGGTMGGQALLFAAVFVLGWVIVKLHAGSNAATQKLVEAANTQREQDRNHHEEFVNSTRVERASNLLEHATNFQVLLTIARDSAIAMTATAKATEQMSLATRELGLAFHEMRQSAHDDAMNPVQREVNVVNKPRERVPVEAIIP